MGNAERADLGGIGEATLLTWCHEVGISPNQANHDRKGFDYLLILPRTESEIAAHHPIDKDPPEFSCFVQVKATRDASKPIKVKLSNWQRFVAAPWPTFFLVVEVGADNKPVRAFLEHVDSGLVESVLMRLAKISPEARERLHLLTMGLKTRESSLLAGTCGASLLGAIRRAIGRDSFGYILAKKKATDESGYGAYPVKAEFSVSATDRADLYEKLADFAVGRSLELTVSSFKISETRFGHERLIKDVREAIEASVRVPTLPSHSSLIMEARGLSGGPPIRLHCNVYHATTLFPFLPAPYRKIALRAEGVTFFITPPEGERSPTVTMSFDLPQRSLAGALARAAPAAQLALALQRESLTYELHTSAGTSALESASLATMPRDFSLYARAVQIAARIVERFPIPLDTDVDLVALANQAETLRMLDAILAGAESPVEATVGFSGDDVLGVESAAIVFATWLDLGDRVLCVVAAIAGAPSWGDGPDGAKTMRLRSGPRQMLVRVLTSEAAERLDMYPIMDEVTQRLLAEDGVDFVVRVGMADGAAMRGPQTTGH